ncbi:proteasome subunit alpha [Candidatus Pacearchaeota archaeon CG10_big_fil_rev_8_21_14_0_10_32_14]|nr:MAG: proteasome subunit alpha [Candidatus Pacearchaeota archaeon CG10_big_fil_rev_8_21_14_0_10_32_14]
MEMPIDMQHQAMGYDRTATMFSPEGHLLQVEYAEKTVRLGVSSIGMVCSDGVFIIADRRITDKLILQESSNRVHEIDNHIIGSIAGITSDGRILVERAQLLAQQHRVSYDSPIETELVIKDISNIKQQFTQYGGARPFGASMMIVGISGKKVELFTSDVTGNYFSYYANAIGENDAKIKDKLREKWKKELTIKQGVKLALDIFKEVQDKGFKQDRYDIAFIETKDQKIKRYTGEEIKDFIK